MGEIFFSEKEKYNIKKQNKLQYTLLNSFLIFFCDLLNNVSLRKILLTASIDV